MRQYLHGDSVWPANIAVVATVCTARGSQEWINAPWLISDDIAVGNFKRIELLVRGIWFWVLLGEIPQQIANWCCVNSSQKVLFMRDYTDEFLLMNRHFLESAEDRTSPARLH